MQMRQTTRQQATQLTAHLPHMIVGPGTTSTSSDIPLTNAMTTSATTTNDDIQWEDEEDGHHIKGAILESNSSSCNLAAANVTANCNGILQVPQIASVTGTLLVHVHQSSNISTEDIFNTIDEENGDSYDRILKRKALDDLQAETTALVDENLHGNEEQELLPVVPVVVDDAKNTDENKRICRVVPSRISWEDRVASLIAYKEEHGHLQIPIRYKKNPSLGKFVHNTREQYKLFHSQSKPGDQRRCSLSIERISDLDNIGFLWTTARVKKQNDDWNIRLDQLKEYKEKHGDCLVPHGYAADPSFAEWIHRQRTAYASMLKDDKPNPLVQSRVQKLEEIGFNFTVHTDKWMDQYVMLKAYKEKHGDCQVPTHYADNPKLGRWTHTQRHQRRLYLKLYKKGSISKDRIALLDELGFNWEVRPQVEQPRATWQQRYEELVDHHKNYGNFLMSPETHPKLYRWCCEQRSRLNKWMSQSSEIIDSEGLEVAENGQSRRLGPDRVKQLLDIGFTGNTTLAKPNNTSVDLRCIDDEGGTQKSSTEPNNRVNERPDNLSPFDLAGDEAEMATDKVNAAIKSQHATDEKIASV